MANFRSSLLAGRRPGGQTTHPPTHPPRARARSPRPEPTPPRGEAPSPLPRPREAGATFIQHRGLGRGSGAVRARPPLPTGALSPPGPPAPCAGPGWTRTDRHVAGARIALAPRAPPAGRQLGRAGGRARVGSRGDRHPPGTTVVSGATVGGVVTVWLGGTEVTFGSRAESWAAVSTHSAARQAAAQSRRESPDIATPRWGCGDSCSARRSPAPSVSSGAGSQTPLPGGSARGSRAGGGRGRRRGTGDTKWNPPRGGRRHREETEGGCPSKRLHYNQNTGKTQETIFFALRVPYRRHLGFSWYCNNKISPPGLDGTTYMTWRTASSGATREAVIPRPHVTSGPRLATRVPPGRKLVRCGALRACARIKFVRCFRVPQVLHMYLAGPVLFTVESDFPVSHPVLGLPGEMEAKWLRLRLRRPRSVRRRNTQAVSCLPARAATVCLSHLPNLIFPNFLLFPSSGSSSQSVPPTQSKSRRRPE